MNELLIGLLGGGSLATIVSSLVMSLSNRRKLGADATEIITRAATGVVTRLEQEIVRKQGEHDAEVTELRGKLDRIIREWKDERESVRRTLQLHVAFDQLAIAKLAEAGIVIGMDPPPLLPPLRANLD